MDGAPQTTTTAPKRPLPYLEAQFCKGCGRCIGSCPKHCITYDDQVDPRTGLVPVVIDLHDCNGCALCIAACPEPYGLRPETAASRGGRSSLHRCRPRRPRRRRQPPTPSAQIGVEGRTHLAAGDRDRGRVPAAPAARAAHRQGQSRRGDRRAARRLPAVLRLPDHPVDRGHRAHGAAPPGARRSVRPGGERGRDHRPPLRRRRRRREGDDLHLVARLQPDARGDELPDRRRAPRGGRERHARRPGPRQHRARAVGHQARLPRARTRAHPRHRARAGLAAGDARPHHARLRADLEVPQSGRPPRGRLPRPDDRQDRPAALLRPARRPRLGGHRRPRSPAQPHHARSTSPRPTSKRTTTTCSRSTPRSNAKRRAPSATARRTPTSCSSPATPRRGWPRAPSKRCARRACAPGSSAR